MNHEKVVFILMVAMLDIISAQDMWPEEESNFSLFKAMTRSNDPERAALCFDYYIPLIKEIVETYQNGYTACLQYSHNSRSKVDAATLANRLALAASANRSCELLSQCSKIDSPEFVFECYASAGAENTGRMYELNLNSTDHLSDLQEEYRLVENIEYKCTNETKRKYEKESTAAYENFNKCNLGLIDVPKSTESPATTKTTNTPETSVTFETTTETRTDIPIETTEKTEAAENQDGVEPLRKPKSINFRKVKY